jgi:hypothetical protein
MVRCMYFMYLVYQLFNIFQMVTLLGHFEVDDKDQQQAVGGALKDFFQKWGDGIELGDVQVSCTDHSLNCYDVQSTISNLV